jgi:hypothetical protein
MEKYMVGDKLYRISCPGDDIFVRMLVLEKLIVTSINDSKCEIRNCTTGKVEPQGLYRSKYFVLSSVAELKEKLKEILPYCESKIDKLTTIEGIESFIDDFNQNKGSTK